MEYALSLAGLPATAPEISITILNLLSSAADQDKDIADKVSLKV